MGVDHEDGPEVVFMRTDRVETVAKQVYEKPPFEVLQIYDSFAYYQEDFPLLVETRGGPSLAHQFVKKLTVSAPASSQASSREPVLRCIGNVLVSSSLDVGSFALVDEGSPAEQCGALLQAASAWLTSLGRSLGDVLYVEVQVRDLSCFDPMNAVYASFFCS